MHVNAVSHESKFGMKGLLDFLLGHDLTFDHRQ